MRYRWSAAVIMASTLCLAGGQAWAEVYAYPKQGQTQEQFEKDQFECHKWATGQTGFDPTKPQQTAAAPPPQRGGAVRGAAGGAAAGAVGGAIAGDAGKGAAVGAAAGATAGALRQGRQNRQAAQAQQQAQAQAQAGQAEYDKAYAACLGGRGYQVR